MVRLCERSHFPAAKRFRSLASGTWNMAERPGHRPEEIAALQMAVDLGMTVIDTAEMYAEGAAEELVAEALGDRRREMLPGQQGSACNMRARVARFRPARRAFAA